MQNYLFVRKFVGIMGGRWNGKDRFCTVQHVVAMLSSRRAVVVIEINACTFRRECDAGLRFSKDRLDSQTKKQLEFPEFLNFIYPRLKQEEIAIC